MKSFNKKKLLLIIGGFICVLLAIAAFVFITNTVVLSTNATYKYEVMVDVVPAQAALILGAKVFSDGSLSHMMQDRADTGFELYKTGKVQKIIMSGDHGTKNYDEVNAVKNYLLQKGVAPEDLFLDHAGFDTYDSLYRARDVFKATSLIVVTQRFHLSRAVYIGRSLGMDVYGYAADKRLYAGMAWNETREIFSRTKAFLDVTFGAKPKFLGDAISIEGDGKVSWD